MFLHDANVRDDVHPKDTRKTLHPVNEALFARSRVANTERGFDPGNDGLVDVATLSPPTAVGNGRLPLVCLGCDYIYDFVSGQPKLSVGSYLVHRRHRTYFW